MTGLGWSVPPPPVLVAGLVGVAAWLLLARSGAGGWLRGGVRLAAAAVLLAILLGVGPRRGGAGAGARLAVLVDRSLSMGIPETGAPSRADAARSWLAGDAYARWRAGRPATVDSFGGATTDPGAAVEAAAAGLPAAVLLVSDGRAAGGRAVEPPGVPLYVLVPQPATLADAATTGLRIDEPGDGPAAAVAEVAAVGGRGVADAGRLVVRVDGAVAGTRAVGRLAAGERRRLRVALPRLRGGERIVEARLERPGDPVPDNDARSVVWRPGEGPRRALVVGLAAGWDLAPWERALAAAHAGPVERWWTVRAGRLRRVDGPGEVGWVTLDPARYDVAVLVGSPALVGDAGRRWLEGFAARGGTGVLWSPEGRGGDLPGGGVAVPPGRGSGRPSVTPAGADWLAAHGARAAGPDGGPAWPPLEALPGSATPPAGAVPLLAAAGRPVAWVAERGASRAAVLLGTGWYRWPIEAGTGPAGAAPAFWEEWSAALLRWLAAASPASRPLVRMPPDGAVPRGAGLEAPVAADARGPVAWRVETADGREAASGEVPEAEGRRAIRVPALDPGPYWLLARVPGGRRGGGRFVVQSVAPDLAWTEADTASLAAAARASGGALLGPGSAADVAPPGPAGGRGPEGPPVPLASRPWAWLLAAVLLLADWALARPEGRR